MANKFVKSFRNKSLTKVTADANAFISQAGVIDAAIEHGQEIGTGTTKQHILVVVVTYEAVRRGKNYKIFNDWMKEDHIEPDEDGNK